ncbi:putative bifunctional diguanylate cyclase/phosphodiesterase [Cellulomonas fimi]|uniref:Diguanylate cyclase/phosphodiesterase with PAS/PAC sensor(S) n=1 Tax=Cellulomonas fimi (strain ATCC 484 / DSM 20113 / JCM 1341 / CCUG 24087 / LMG 16345 / NBRC 15513 / NCIMB 8980 / NCTC 7547 / NRS-133) TaxID=590998 RepID=F4H758_CELFA|nr:EAL domain-containing protein [Cellulomonas fimi]AEE45692.1 diguanylate cyclase/phosphodiesterase with PAS/PAC sensor(s) [Cellulomonas fimi ATCC 484]NNH07391.1 EAL domain-containing protein [Cellulomonas fimi]VEH30306.1 Cyclic di-GMP phosphodiesterase Gmr [Cellulomonas fimi]
MSEVLADPAGVVTAVIAVVAIAALVAVLVLLARQRAQVRTANGLLELSRQLRQRYDALQSVTKEGVLVQSLSGRVLDMSERAAAILGVDAESATGRPVTDLPLVLVNEQGLSMNPAAVLGHRGPVRPSGPGEPELVGVAFADPEGMHVRMVQVASQLVPAGDGENPAVLTTLVDVTGRREVEAALSRSETQFRVAMENAPIGMALVDLDWRIVEANAAFAELLGTRVDALRGYPMADLAEPEGRAAERVEVDRLLEGGLPRFSLEQQYVRADGLTVWVVLDAALVRSASGSPDHFVVQVRDSTESRLQAEMLTHRAMHDPLTGLANRTLMQEVLQSVLEQPGVVDRVAVIACDLDGFKQVNDRYGHAAGDELLVHVAAVLRAATARRGTVARLGGDEFVVVVQDADGPRAVFEIAAAIHAGLVEPARIARRRVQVAASIGIALADPETVEGGAPALLAAADAALYRAKGAGRGRTEVYDSSMGVATTSSLHRELTDAIATRQLVVHYQPIVDLADMRVVGYEALVRWQHPHRGLLLPGAFLPLVQEAGMSVPLAQFVATEVVEFVSQTTDRTRWVSINVSADQLGDGEFATTLLGEISRRRVAAGRIVVELTESSLVASGTRIRHELTQLSAAGVPILLDDFGTGVSPLSYLRDLPVAGVKLDMSFTSGIPDDPTAGKVARALGALARELAMVTIAEGIEHDEQARYLHRNGWRYGQGWLFGGAQPGDVSR